MKTFSVAGAVKYQDINFEDVFLAFVHFELHNDGNTLIAHFSLVSFILTFVNDCSNVAETFVVVFL